MAKHFKNKKDILNFDKIGKDLNLLLWAQKNKLINSWELDLIKIVQIINC